MVVASHWWAVVVFAMVMTVAWLFVEDRVTTTALLAGAAWSFAALTGGNLTRHAVSNGDHMTYTVSVGYIQYIAVFLALLSFLVLLLYRFGLYPPEDDDPYQGEPA